MISSYIEYHISSYIKHHISSYIEHPMSSYIEHVLMLIHGILVFHTEHELCREHVNPDVRERDFLTNDIDVDIDIDI